MSPDSSNAVAVSWPRRAGAATLVVFCWLPVTYLALLSLARDWAFPALLPPAITLATWRRALVGNDGLVISFATSASIALLVATLATAASGVQAASSPIIATAVGGCWRCTHCAHCYNDSGPQGERVSLDDCLAIVENLPTRLGRLILSGGEPLTERPKLHAILEAARTKYGTATEIVLQTNGDLLTPEILDELLARGVSRIEIASMDRFHKHQGERRAILEQLFESRGLSGAQTDPLIARDNFLTTGRASYGFWGANAEMWLGGNWARGRAVTNRLWLRDPSHNFCAILSGARGFLDGTDLPQELCIQLWKLNPCCPGTTFPLGDARRDRVSAILDRVAAHPVFQRLNAGDPLGMGETVGVSREQATARNTALQNICLTCDEFFREHFDYTANPSLLTGPAVTSPQNSPS